MTVSPMPKPPEPVYDLDAVIAEREPAQPFTFRFGGDIYTLPARPDMRAAAAFSAERIDEGFRLLLGQDQWDRMQAADAVFDDQAFLNLQVAYMQHLGEDLGESAASAISSRNTAKP